MSISITGRQSNKCGNLLLD